MKYLLDYSVSELKDILKEEGVGGLLAQLG